MHPGTTYSNNSAHRSQSRPKTSHGALAPSCMSKSNFLCFPFLPFLGCRHPNVGHVILLFPSVFADQRHDGVPNHAPNSDLFVSLLWAQFHIFSFRPAVLFSVRSVVRRRRRITLLQKGMWQTSSSSWPKSWAKDWKGWWSEDQGTDGESQSSKEPWDSGHPQCPNKKEKK